MKSAGSPGAAPEDVGMMDDAAPGSPGMGGGDPYDAMAGAASEEDAASRLAQLQMQVEAQAQQLEVESKTNAELEDMLLRIEKHFKAEQVARRKAEEMVAEAESKIAAERAAKEAISAELNNVGHEAERNKALKAALSAEQGALESEKNKVMAEIEEARSDANRAAEALAKAEEAISQEETVARLKLEAEHNAKVARLATEIDRLKEELEMRTNAMGNEMMRWKVQADAAAHAVSVAKDEVMERKRELDNTKEKIDHLVEKLYIGREKGLELRGAIDFHLERHRTNYQHGRSLMPGIGGADKKKGVSSLDTARGVANTDLRSQRAKPQAKPGVERERVIRAKKKAADPDMFGAPSRDINNPGGMTGGAGYGGRGGARGMRRG